MCSLSNHDEVSCFFFAQQQLSFLFSSRKFYHDHTMMNEYVATLCFLVACFFVFFVRSNTFKVHQVLFLLYVLFLLMLLVTFIAFTASRWSVTIPIVKLLRGQHERVHNCSPTWFPFVSLQIDVASLRGLYGVYSPQHPHGEYLISQPKDCVAFLLVYYSIGILLFAILYRHLAHQCTLIFCNTLVKVY